MDPAFWHRRWQKNEIAFHETKPNDLLVRYFNELELLPNSLIFLPLCGKTLDIDWILAQKHRVVAIELDSMAVEQLFERLAMVPEKWVINDDLTCYQGPNVTIYQGDIFKLTAEQLGSVDAVYDRAALVALPEGMRLKYCHHMLEICRQTKQLLIVFEYHQGQMAGPPFSVSGSDIKQYYSRQFTISKLDSHAVSVRGVAASEQVWLLKPPDNEQV